MLAAIARTGMEPWFEQPNVLDVGAVRFRAAGGGEPGVFECGEGGAEGDDVR